MREIGIALLGFGNVGLGTYQIFEAHSEDIERRVGARVRVRHVLVRNPAKLRSREPAKGLLTVDYQRILDDEKVEVVVELIGGTQVAREHVLRAIAAGRHVVTANKALLSEHGEELFGSALKAGVDLYFEGAVCGGIPIIRTLREALASDRMEAIYGIVNGTTNLILTEMAEKGVSYSEALKRAQELGYAEADPTLDVNGSDAAQKLCLLASLAFMARLKPTQLAVEGILGLLPIDFAMAREFGFVVKLLALARRTRGGALEARVYPAFVPQHTPLADVRGAFNAVLLKSAALGQSMLSGQGAGALPTGSAVVSDVIDICRNILAGVSGRLPTLCAPHLREIPLRPAGERRGACYLRFTVSDEPGVLGRIAGVLGEKGVSIASVIQRQPLRTEPGSPATIVVFTHEATESEVEAALHWIDQLKTTRAPSKLIRIEDAAQLGSLNGRSEGNLEPIV